MAVTPIFPTTNDIEHLFMGLLPLSISSLAKSLFRSLSYFFNWFISILMCSLFFHSLNVVICRTDVLNFDEVSFIILVFYVLFTKGSKEALPKPRIFS